MRVDSLAHEVECSSAATKPPMDQNPKEAFFFPRILFIDIAIAFNCTPLYSLKRMKLIMMRHADHENNVLTADGIKQITTLSESLPRIIATHNIDVSRVLFLVSPQGRTAATAHRLKSYLESCGMLHYQLEVVAAFDQEEPAGYQQAVELIVEHCKRKDFTLVWVVTHFFQMVNVPELVLELVHGSSVDPFELSTFFCEPVLIDMITGEGRYPL